MRGFTLSEMIVVVSIIAVVTSASLFGGIQISERARYSRAQNDAKNLKNGVLQYHADMGFFPPDVNRGMDPGLAQALPTNPDTGTPITVTVSATVNTHLPANWATIVQQRWNGPYIDGRFPIETPWKGEYDYNAWSTNTNVGTCLAVGGSCTSLGQTCVVPAGFYIGILPAAGFGGSTAPRVETEQRARQDNVDNDGCVNGTIQIRIASF